MKVRFYVAFTVVMLLVTLGAGGSRLSPASAASIPDANIPVDFWSKDYVSVNPLGGSHVSVAVDENDGNRAWVSYYSEVYGGLMVAHYVGAGLGNCGDPDNAWLCEEVDKVAGESKGLYSSIAVFPDNNPAPDINAMKVGVSYYDETNKSLKFAEYSCTSATNCAWSVQTVESSTDVNDDVGRYASLDFGLTGTPHISYYMVDILTAPQKTEMVKHALFVGGGSGNCGDNLDWACHVVDSSPNSLGMHTSIDIDWLNEVYISYYDGFNGALKYATMVGTGGNCGSMGDWRCETIDLGASADVGKFSAMHSCVDEEDYLRIAYYDQTAGTLKYAYNIFSGGNCGESGNWQCDVIDEVGVDLPQMDIAIEVAPDNKPMVAYTEQTEDLLSYRLRVAQRAPEYSYSNCGGELWTRWWCQTLDDGTNSIERGLFLDFDLKANGLAVIAYTELDKTNELPMYNVKITFEHALTQLPLVTK